MVKTRLLELLCRDGICCTIAAIELGCDEQDGCIWVDRLDLSLEGAKAVHRVAVVDSDAKHEAVCVRVYELTMCTELGISAGIDNLDIDRPSVKLALTAEYV